MNLVRCEGSDRRLLAALADAGLPTADLGREDAQYFSAWQAGALVGFGGLQGIDSDQILRSVVVLGDVRGSGVGRRIAESLCDIARASGASRLWLLTTDAAPFFQSLGWAHADRETAPLAISRTDQFVSLCPASAAFMVLDLTR